jgi:translation initiation factor IF-2
MPHRRGRPGGRGRPMRGGGPGGPTNGGRGGPSAMMPPPQGDKCAGIRDPRARRMCERQQQKAEVPPPGFALPPEPGPEPPGFPGGRGGGSGPYGGGGRGSGRRGGFRGRAGGGRRRRY